MNAEATPYTAEEVELMEIAAFIRIYQERAQLSDIAFCRRFSDLGHTKTYAKIRNGELDELNVERQLANYRAVKAIIEGIGDDVGRDEELYGDIWATLKLNKAMLDVFTEHDVSRCVFILGPSGSGKTSAQRFVARKYGSRCLTVQANEVWNDKPLAMLGEILDALGIKDIPHGAMERLKMVKERLCETRRCILLEDGHHMGPRCLNVLINLIDNTPGEIVIGAIDSLWTRLVTKAYAECRQLTGNRLAERIDIGSAVRESDVRKIVAKRIEWAPGELEKLDKLTHQVAEKAKGYGLLSFVREVVKRMNVKLKSGRETILATAEDFVAAIAEEVAAR